MSLTTSHVVPADRESVWDWHSRPGALTRLSPPFVPMTPIRQAERLSDGTTTFALPAGLKWVSRHDLSAYRRGYQFTDVCTSAPFKAVANWRHVHQFADHPEGTLVTDQVSTRLPAASLTAMFAYRQHQLIEDIRALARFRAFTPTDAEGAQRTLRVAMTGSRGLIGRALTAQLTTAGHEVIQLVRREPREGQRRWDPHYPDQRLLDGVDVLVHLAGEPISGRFSEAHKTALRDSRVEPTERLARLVANSDTCHTMVSASAIGFYGADRGDELLTEQSERGEGFLAEAVADWETATGAAEEAGKRVVRIRTGLVLSGRGGLLPPLRTLFSAGLGGNFGDGSFWMSWIAMDDITDIYVRAILDEQLTGVINGVSPNPIRNRDMVTALSSELHRPAFLQIPAIGPKMVLGKEGAQQLAMADQRTAPTVLDRIGHHFRYPTVSPALAHELGQEDLWDKPAAGEPELPSGPVTELESPATSEPGADPSNQLEGQVPPPDEAAGPGR